MVEMGKRVMDKAAREGRCVIVGRGAPYFLREHPDAFHVFLYAPYAEKLRRLRASGSRIQGNPEELLNTRRPRPYRFREALFQCRLANPFPLPCNDQYSGR